LLADRKALLHALERVGRVVPNNGSKPILQGVRLEAADGTLRLTATDLDVSLTTLVEVDGELPACLVSCQELTRRLKASKADVCSISLNGKQHKLTINGAAVEHRLHTMDLAEFPVVPDHSQGPHLTLDSQELRSALTTTLIGTAREPTRYAINGVLVESDDQGARLVATDGRRLAIVTLASLEQEFSGQAILPSRFATLITKLIDRKSEDHIRLSIHQHPEEDGQKQPSDVYVAGRDWLLTSQELEGHFSVWRDVVPESHSRFLVDRQAFLDTLDEVAVATNEEARGVRVDLRPRSVKLSAQAPGLGESTGTVRARFEGGGDSRIITGFNPDLLRDALKTLSGDRVVIDVGQNMPNLDTNTIRGKPALIYSATSQAVRWVIMPINTGLRPTAEMLGSNYEVELRASA
jgi:DNA polymerase-3 subunit beta